jgi:PAS domain S-box-containing protein
VDTTTARPTVLAVAPSETAFARLREALGPAAGRLDGLDAWAGPPDATLDAVIFEADAAGSPIALAREARERAPFAQIVFVGTPESLARVRQKLLLVGGLSELWSFLPDDAPARWAEALGEARERAARRRALKQRGGIPGAPAPRPIAQAAAEAPPPLQLAGVLDHMREAVLSLDLRGVIRYANPAATALLGVDAEALVGTAMTGHLRGDELARLLDDVARGGPGDTLTLTQSGPAGDRAVEASLSPVRDWRGQLSGMTVIARDVSDRLAAERLAVVEAEHQATIAHVEEVRALNEELTAQTEELNQLYDELKGQHARIEAEVAARTAALRASEKRLNEAQSLAQIGHWELEHATQRLSWSDELYRIFGLSPEGEPITLARYRATLHPDDRAHAESVLSEAHARGGLFTYEARFLRPDGTARVLHTRGEVLLGPDGQPRLTMGVCHDITERRAQEDAIARQNAQLQDVNEQLTAQTEELAAQQAELQDANSALAAQRQLLASVLEHLPAGVGYADRHLVVQVVNAEFAHNYGRQATDFIGKTFAEAFPETEFPGMAARAEAPLRAVMASGEPWRSVAYPITFADAAGCVQTRYRDAVVVPVHDARGAVEGVLSLSLDVTARVLAEQEAARSAAALAAQITLTERIIRHAPVVMAYVDRDLVYRWNNAAHCQLVGKPAEAVVDHRLDQVLPPAFYARTAPLYRQVLASGEPHFEQAFPARLSGPDTTYLDFSYVPIPDEAGVPQGLLIIAVDVTDRVERDRLQAATIAALEQADRAKNEFVSVISHELRTPLNFITGFASTLEDEVQGPLNDAQRQAVGKILAGSERMLLLVDDLLDFARMQAGTFHLSLEPTDFRPLVEEVAATMRLLADRKDLALALEITGDFAPCVDGHRIIQVLSNLVSNAIKFTDTGTITVRVEAQGGCLLTSVHDTGCGIAASDLPKLFQRFSQIDMSATRKVGGTGLGLAISKAIVEAHGGTIGVESAPGVGSTFSFTLPLPEAHRDGRP